jgi:hypothetical protein
MTTNLTSQPAHELGDLLDGPVLADADPRVAAELAPFNCTFTPSPAVTVGATSAREVAAAVRWAGDHGHPVAVVATGHGLHSDLSGALAVSTDGCATSRSTPTRVPPASGPEPAGRR